MSKNKQKTILITGGAGFIGSHFIRYWLNTYKQSRVINLDLLTYAGDKRTLRDVANNSRYYFHKGDIGNSKTVNKLLKKYKPDIIVNFAAESDNNKAIQSPLDFARTNVYGTAVLLEAARNNRIRRFHHISTCEVFGQLPLASKKTFQENSPYRPRTPYNASKAAADHIVRSYFHTFGYPITISNACNNYGSHQFPEKVIPVFIIKAIRNQQLPVFKSSQNKREWIHVLDHCRGIDMVLQKGKIGESYNIGTGLEKTIDQLADDILKIIGKPKSLKKYIPDRLGHDSRYLLNSTRIKKLGWKPEINWQAGLSETINWFKDNKWWWDPLLKDSHSWKDK